MKRRNEKEEWKEGIKEEKKKWKEGMKKKVQKRILTRKEIIWNIKFGSTYMHIE